MATPTHEEMLAMSDEDFGNLNEPPAEELKAEAGTESDPAGSETSQEEVKEPAATDPVDSVDSLNEADPEDRTDSKDPKDSDEDENTSDDDLEKAAETGTDSEKKPEKADAADSESASTTEEDPKDPEAETASIDYEASFKKIMAPFKANGKMIELRTPEEAIQLMQMGANYTRKLQELQPHRKIVMMLQNNDLLDEGKLSYLIDLDKKNPEAIKKLIKDSGVDPLDIDTNVEPAYSPGSHSVSDEEANFRSVMEDIKSTPSGTETLIEIHGRWDDTSKQALWKSPEIMSVIHQQRENGIYDQITAEMDRQITLGKIPANTPFLEAYKTVGDAMVEATKQAQGGEPQVGATQETGGSAAAPVATRAAAPKSRLANGDRAKAASPTRSTPKKAETLKNPLAQSDEEFLKSMEGRL